MKAKLFQNKISARPSQIHNYGVFADKNIKKGEMIEECPMLPFEYIHPSLTNYYFAGEGGASYLLMGYGMIYNHSDYNNADYIHYKDTEYMTFVAKRFIPKGEEIFINYGAGWFEERKLKRKNITTRISLINNPLTVSLTRMSIACGLLYGGFLALTHSYEPWRALMASFGFSDLIK